jgi:hypothetical protein
MAIDLLAVQRLEERLSACALEGGRLLAAIAAWTAASRRLFLDGAGREQDGLAANDCVARARRDARAQRVVPDDAVDVPFAA